MAGGAGGGIDNSTGEGVSPITSPAVLPFLDRAERNNGVEFVDLDPRNVFLAWVGFVGRIAGDCFFRDGCEFLSSPLDEAFRLFDGCSHGLVIGEIS